MNNKQLKNLDDFKDWEQASADDFNRSVYKRTYKMFLDESYFGMWCVRDILDRDFNSRTSWHFASKEDAENLLNLLNKAK